jgi:hypothetical protein
VFFPTFQQRRFVLRLVRGLPRSGNRPFLSVATEHGFLREFEKWGQISKDRNDNR